MTTQSDNQTTTMAGYTLVPYTPLDAGIIEKALTVGDVAKMDSTTRVHFYRALCQSTGLNPLTRPFILLKTPSGELTWYATVGAAEQLRKLHRVSTRILSRERTEEGLYIVTVQASAPDGRQEESQGIVFVGGLKGQELGNAMMRCGCVPLETEILTKRGWLTHDTVQIGEDVLAYDCHTDTCCWTPLEALTRYDEALTVNMGTTFHHFRCTLDHTWAVSTNPYRQRGLRKRGPYANRQPSRMLTETSALNAGHKIILAAPAPGGDSPLTPHEAAVLGWIMTDGSIKRKKTSMRLAICQSKEENFPAIETALTGTGYTVSRYVGQPSVREFPSGHQSVCLPQHWWYLSAYDSRTLFAKAGIESPADLPALIPHLSQPARHAMLEAMMAADGTKSRGTFGKKRKPGVMDAWQILATLEGYALGHYVERKALPSQRLRMQRYIAGRNITSTEPRVEAVWCPTTQYGTWVMRQNGDVTITGNSKALRRVTLALCGLGMAGAEEESGQVIAFDPQTGAVELPPPAPEAEAATLLTVVGRWFRQRHKDSRETVAQAVWGVQLTEMPHLGYVELAGGLAPDRRGQAPLDVGQRHAGGGSPAVAPGACTEGG